MIIDREIQRPLLHMCDVMGIQPSVMLAWFLHATGATVTPVPVLMPGDAHTHPLSRRRQSTSMGARVGIGLVPISEYKKIGYRSPKAMMEAMSDPFDQVRSSFAYLHYCVGNRTGLATEVSTGLRLAREVSADPHKLVTLLDSVGLVGCSQCPRVAISKLKRASEEVRSFTGCQGGGMLTSCDGDGMCHKDVRTISQSDCPSSVHKRQAWTALLRSGQDLMEAAWDYC